MKKEKTLTRGSLLCTNILISSPYLEVEYIFYFCVTFIYFYYFAFWIYLFNDMGRTSGCFGTPINNNYIIKCSGASLQAGFFFSDIFGRNGLAVSLLKAMSLLINAFGRRRTAYKMLPKTREKK